MNQSVPYLLREATIFDVDPVNFTCSLHYGDLNSSEISHGVPMPNLLGVGNAGLIINLLKGTKVIALYMHDKSFQPVVIVAVLSSSFQKDPEYNTISNSLADKANGTIAYPRTLLEGEAYLSAHTGPFLWLKKDDSFHLSSRDGSGTFLIPNKRNRTSNLFQLANNHSLEGSGGKLNWGRVKRSLQNIGFNSKNTFFTDINRDSELRDIGFWYGNEVSSISSSFRNRNPALSEYKLVINEFSTEFGFSGFDEELKKSKDPLYAVKRRPNMFRDREYGNILKSTEGELIEIVAGNLVDINADILDINYNSLMYSPIFPSIDVSAKIEEARLKSRRGVGYHFKLSTNTTSTSESRSKNDFCFDIDKEGMLKVNIPASSTTGNIPYVNDVSFGSKDSERKRQVSAANPSSFEKIPVHTRKKDGTPTTKVKTPIRETGVRFLNTDDAYFPISEESGKRTVRVSPTKHHNIYAAAERLIANQITDIQAPFAFSTEKTISFAGSSITTQRVPDDINEYSKDSVFEVVYDGKDSVDDAGIRNQTLIKNLFYSAVQVTPGAPAISTGGNTTVAGVSYSGDDTRQPILSNYFSTSDDNGNIVVSKEGDSFSNVKTHGGVSANVNMEGSLELSLGGDNADNKSFILDTAGSLIMWLGKDKQNRSMILQSDGDVLFNIGGSYEKSNSAEDTPKMNYGRFDLRVNVVDKGFYDSGTTKSGNKTKYGAGTVDDKPNSSDYIISISEHGLVIAGMKSGAPMVIRNDGPLILESASDKITLKGMSVETVEFGKTPKS